MGGPHALVATLLPCAPPVREELPPPEGGGDDDEMAVLRLFAGAREAAGTSHAEVPGATVAEVIAAARLRFGEPFTSVLEHCQVWRNGEPSQPGDPVDDADEVAVLPPVSGGL